MPLEEKHLALLSTPSNFRLGRVLFGEGAVAIRKRVGYTVHATVGGGVKRRVELSWTGRELRWKCTCRKNLRKLCKHCVAVGLAMVKER